MLEEERSKAAVYTGIFMGFFALAGNLIEMEPIHNLFTGFAAWSCILIMDTVIFHIKGNSLIASRFTEFALLIPASLFIWVIFELINVRLYAWHYVNIASTMSTRWIGYALAHAALLPALFEMTEFMETLGLLKKGIKIKPPLMNRQFLKHLMEIGGGCIIAALLVPKYLPVLAFIGILLLVEPINYRLGVRSLLKDWLLGDTRKFCLIFSAGLLFGLMREFLNSVAGAHIAYTAPWAGNLTLFAMPLPLYALYPLIALDAYALYNLLSYLRCGKSWEEGADKPLKTIRENHKLAISISILVLFAIYAGFVAVDKNNVGLYLGFI